MRDFKSLKEKLCQNIKVSFTKKNEIINMINFVFLVYGIICYKRGLINCTKSIALCAKQFDNPFLFKIYINVAKSALSLEFFFLTYFYKYARFRNILFVLPFYLYYFLTDTGDGFESHGAINLMLLGATLLLLTLIFIAFKNLVRFCVRVNGIKAFCLLSLIILFFIKVYFRFFGTYPCGDFYVGIGGESISFNPEYDKCKMIELEECNLKNWDGVMDLNYWLNYQCRKEPRERQQFIMYMDPDSSLRKAKRFGFPSSHQIPIFNLSTVTDMPKMFLPLLKDLDKEPNFFHEIEVEFDENDHGKMSINVTRNETLVKEREEIRKKHKKPFSKNVLFLYFDAISRRVFIKQFPKTVSFINQYFIKQGEKIDKTKKFASFEFPKLTSVATYTIPNNFAMFLGTGLHTMNGTHIVKHLKEGGYITGLMTDGCQRESFDYFFDKDYDQSNPNMTYDYYDHEGNIMFCDGNYIDLIAPHRKPNGIYGPLKRCLYGKEIQEYMFDYSEKFWKAYYDQPKFLKIGFNNGHEVSVEEAKYLDEPLYNFLVDWLNKGYLDETTLFFMSDHGNQISVLLELISREHNIEVFLPTFYLMLPVKNSYIGFEKTQEVADNLLFNKNRFETQYDIYPTLVEIAFFNEPKLQEECAIDNGLSFLQKITKKRDCNDYIELRDEKACRCF